MEPATLVEALEGLDTRRGAALLRSHSGKEGLAHAYLSRLMGYFASDQAAALRLGRHCSAVVRHADRRDLAHRSQAIVQLIQGRWLPSARSFQDAGDSSKDPVERLSFKVGALHALGKAGRIDEAISLAKELRAGLSALGQEPLAARALLNLGNALLERDRFAEAIDAFSEALPMLKGAEAASARLGLSTANLYGGSLSVAKGEAEKVITRSRRTGNAHLERLARINLAHVALLRGRPEEALDQFLALERELSDVPAEKARCQEFLGDAYLRLNLWDEALDAYRQAIATGVESPNNLANIELGVGYAHSGAGERRLALDAFQRAFRLYRRVGNDAWAAAALTEQAEIKDSRALAKRAADLARKGASPYHLAIALLAVGGPAELQEADRIVRRYGYAGLEWRVAFQQAKQSNGATRLKHYRRMFDAIQRGRATTRSAVSRASYLRDKAEALREFLGELLEHPTGARVEEAVRIVLQSRSVALLDEVLSAGSLQLKSSDLDRLSALRTELESFGDSEPPTGVARRLTGPSVNLAGVQRRWQEATRLVLDGLHDGAARAREDTAIYIEANDRLYVVVGKEVNQLSIRPSELSDSLRWLHFDLSAPIVDRHADPDAALKGLRDVGEAVLGPIRPLLPLVKGVSADGTLWRMPWDACLSVLGVEQGLEVRLHPGFQGGDRMLPDNPRVALWVSAPPDLPHAEKEAEAFVALFPQSEIFRTADGVRKGCTGRYDLVHVIGHARQREANPMFSYFSFTDGPLYAAETARLGFKTSVAVLSACDTGAISLVSLDEPDGLARAFLARGASSVVASAWPLDDEAASRFSGVFYRSLLAGDGVRCAVDSSRKALRSWNEHPYYWGCPMLYGGYQH